jgi:hypothetical protein
MAHGVRRTADFERSYRLEVFELEVELAAGALRQQEGAIVVCRSAVAI